MVKSVTISRPYRQAALGQCDYYRLTTSPGSEAGDHHFPLSTYLEPCNLEQGHDRPHSFEVE